MRRKKIKQTWADANPVQKAQDRYVKPSPERCSPVRHPAPPVRSPSTKRPPKKYVLTDETRVEFGTVLYRIKAVRAFDEVVEGQLGGFVESEYNLSHDGNCWIAQNALAMNRSKVRQNAWLMDECKLMAFADISGDVCLFDRVVLHGKVVVYGSVQIYGDTTIGGRIHLRGDLRLNDTEELMVFLRKDRERKKRGDR